MTSPVRHARLRPPRLARAFAAWLLLLAGPVLAAVPAEDIQRLIDSYAQNRQFNGVVLVAQGGRILSRYAHGEAGHAWGIPNATDTRFRIGSLSKPFTATLVMQLVQEGRLGLDDHLGERLPELYAGTDAAMVTVAQLLGHTSGLRDIPGHYADPWWQTEARHAYTPEAFARAWIPGTLESPPGTVFRYNNNGYFLLGLLIERATGMDYAQALQQRILAPSGMHSSGLYRADAQVPRLANGHAWRPDGSVVPAAYIDPSVSYAAAGLYATVDDLYRFEQALRAGHLLDPAALRRMWTPGAQGYGLGWSIASWPLADGGHAEVMQHTGSVPGYQSHLLRSDHDQSFVVVLDNDSRGELVVTMGKDLMEVLLGKPVAPAKKSLGDLLVPIAVTHGYAAMQAAHAALGPERATYDTGEAALNALGYRLLRLQQIDAATEVFGWNVAAHPDSGNVHDSLGEAYRTAGRIGEALASYRRALALDPDNTNAAQAIAQMQASGR